MEIYEIRREMDVWRIMVHPPEVDRVNFPNIPPNVKVMLNERLYA